MPTTVSEAVKELKALQKHMRAYEHASGMLYFDSVTAAPSDTAAGRGETMGILAEDAHCLFVSEKTGDLLAFLRAHAGELDRVTARETEELSEDYERERRLPVEEVVAYEKLLNDAQAVWHRAKADNDYAAFEPYLRRIVETNRRFAGYYDPHRDAYDVLLDTYEKGLDRQKVDAFFASVRDMVVPLVAKVTAAGDALDNAFLFQHYPVEKQRELSDYIMELMGLDRRHCAIGETEHPFTIGFNKDDVRITTHYYENDLASSLYSVIHEGGHAIYELGLDDNIRDSYLAGKLSMSIHESQSRFFENIIGRSRAFIGCLFPKLQDLFPRQLSGVTADMFYRAVNKSTPSLIRTEADELTYPLHVMVRYELEKQLIDGTLDTKDLPEQWNALYRAYLGVDVPDDTHGVLQDSHWSGGSIGYFPSYALGSAYGAQMLRAMQRDLDVFGTVEAGDLRPVKTWLREKIHRFGGLLTPSELLQQSCGEPFDPAVFGQYLSGKFREIYAFD